MRQCIKKAYQKHFVFEFEYRAKGKGYWTYEYMVLQLKDFADCFRVLYPHIKFVFMLDHSCGHGKQREDGLNAANMGKSFEGTQAKLQDTHIKEEKGYLGPFPSILKVSDVQQMIFDPTDDGPFWVDAGTQGKKRNDVLVSGRQKKREYIKDELQKMLLEKDLP
jgi:hypothetical protein